MNSPNFIQVFPRQLRYWTIHSSINALPSLGIALVFLKLWKNPEAIAAMISAIAVVVLIYATVTSLLEPFSNRSHILSRSLHLALKIRIWIVGISIGLISTGIGATYTPDFWCGFFANHVLKLLGHFFFGGYSGLDVSNVDGQSFFPVFATTLLEGLILSVLLMLIAFFSIIFLQGRDRRRRFQGDSPNLL